MQVHDDLIPWGEQQVERRAQEAASRAAAKAATKASAKGYAEGYARGFAEGYAKGRAEAHQELLPILRRSLANRARGRFGERIARLLSSEIELLEDPAAFDRICGWLETCESGESLLALVRAG